MEDSKFKFIIFLMLIIFSIGVFFSGYSVGSGFSNIENSLSRIELIEEVRKSAIDAGVGEYNATTGSFQWKDIKSATSSH